MTIQQKQCLLLFLGYYSGAVDGVWGARSQAAAREFQRAQGLAVSGEADAQTQEKLLEAVAAYTGDWWDSIEYFDKTEFACKCGRYCDGYPAQISRTLVQAADRVRKHFGAAVIVSSGLRCETHNHSVGGVANSRHLCGKAMDFCVTGKTAAAVLEFVQQQPEIRYAYAIDGSYVHMDVT